MTVAALILLHAVTPALSLSPSGIWELSTTTDISIVVGDDPAPGGDGVVVICSAYCRLVD